MNCNLVLRGVTQHIKMHFKNDSQEYISVTNVVAKVYNGAGTLIETIEDIRFLSMGLYICEYTCPENYSFPEITFAYEGTYNDKIYGDRKTYEVGWVSND